MASLEGQHDYSESSGDDTEGDSSASDNSQLGYDADVEQRQVFQPESLRLASRVEKQLEEFSIEASQQDMDSWDISLLESVAQADPGQDTASLPPNPDRNWTMEWCTAWDVAIKNKKRARRASVAAASAVRNSARESKVQDNDLEGAEGAEDNETPSVEGGSPLAILRDFRQFALLLSRVIVREINMAPLDKTLPPRGGLNGFSQMPMFSYGGVFIKLATRGVGKGLYSTDLIAHKVLGNELRGMSIVNHLAPKGLTRSLAVLIDLHGHRLLCTAKVPINSSTLVCGSEDGGKTVHNSSPKLAELQAYIAKKLRLQPHVVQPLGSGGEGADPLVMSLAADIEGHIGFDGAHYLLDLARLMPPLEPRAAGQHNFILFRPEFLRSTSTKLCSDGYSRWLCGDPLHKSHNAANTAATQAVMEERAQQCLQELCERLSPIKEQLPAILASHQVPDDFIHLVEDTSRARGLNRQLLGALLLACELRVKVETQQMVELKVIRVALLQIMVVRACKQRVRKLKRCGAAPSAAHDTVVCQAFLQALLEKGTVVGKTLWETIIPFEMAYKFFTRVDLSLPIKELLDWPPLVECTLLWDRICAALNITASIQDGSVVLETIQCERIKNVRLGPLKEHPTSGVVVHSATAEYCGVCNCFDSRVLHHDKTVAKARRMVLSTKHLRPKTKKLKLHASGDPPSGAPSAVPPPAHEHLYEMWRPDQVSVAVARHSVQQPMLTVKVYDLMRSAENQEPVEFKIIGNETVGTLVKRFTQLLNNNRKKYELTRKDTHVVHIHDGDTSIGRPSRSVGSSRQISQLPTPEQSQSGRHHGNSLAVFAQHEREFAAKAQMADGGVRPMVQHLLHDGKILRQKVSIKHYNVQDGDVLFVAHTRCAVTQPFKAAGAHIRYLGTFPLFVHVPEINQRFRLLVSSEFKLAQVKRMLEDTTRISRVRMKLAIYGTVLKDRSTLRDNQIRSKSNVTLIIDNHTEVIKDLPELSPDLIGADLQVEAEIRHMFEYALLPFRAQPDGTFKEGPEREKLTAIFRSLDRDQSGKLDSDEIRVGIYSLLQKLTEPNFGGKGRMDEYHLAMSLPPPTGHVVDKEQFYEYLADTLVDWSRRVVVAPVFMPMVSDEKQQRARHRKLHYDELEEDQEPREMGRFEKLFMVRQALNHFVMEVKISMMSCEEITQAIDHEEEEQLESALTRGCRFFQRGALVVLFFPFYSIIRSVHPKLKERQRENRDWLYLGKKEGLTATAWKAWWTFTEFLFMAIGYPLGTLLYYLSWASVGIWGWTLQFSDVNSLLLETWVPFLLVGHLAFDWMSVHVYGLGGGVPGEPNNRWLDVRLRVREHVVKSIRLTDEGETMEDDGDRGGFTLREGLATEVLSKNVEMYCFRWWYVLIAGAIALIHCLLPGAYRLWTSQPLFGANFSEWMLLSSHFVITLPALTYFLVLFHEAWFRYDVMSIQLANITHVASSSKAVSAGFSFYLDLRHAECIDYWLLLRKRAKIIDPSLLTTVASALLFDVMLLSMIIIRILFLKHDVWSVLSILGVFDVILLSVLLILFILEVVSINWEAQVVHQQVLERAKMQTALTMNETKDLIVGKPGYEGGAKTRKLASGVVGPNFVNLQQQAAREDQQAHELIQRKWKRYEVANAVLDAAIVQFRTVDQPVALFGVVVDVNFLIKMATLMATGAGSLISAVSV